MSQRAVGFFCPQCSRYSQYSFPPATEAQRCQFCGKVMVTEPSAALQAGDPIDRCPHCQCRELYLRKDFPQQVGCAAVAATVLLSSLAYAVWGFLASLAVLVLASLLDLALYHSVGEVTVCYRCHTELRGFLPNPEHRAFDLNRAEEYEHESV